MKVNAPDKIYVHVRANKELGTTGHGKNITNGDIEYVRKDAFIEWLKDCSTYEDFNGNTCVDEDLFSTMVKDFEKYMEDKV